MSQNEQYDPKVLRKLQLAELEVFKDFIKICDENGLSYFLFAGCAIGVVATVGTKVVTVGDSCR